MDPSDLSRPADLIPWLVRPLYLLSGVALVGFSLVIWLAWDQVRVPGVLLVLLGVGLGLTLLHRTRWSLFALADHWVALPYSLALGWLVSFVGHFLPPSLWGQVLPHVIVLGTLLLLAAALGRRIGYAFVLGYLLETPLATWYADRLAAWGFGLPPHLSVPFYLSLGGLSAIVVVELTTYIRETLLRHSRRLAAVNRVAQALAVSIDLQTLLSVIKAVIQDVLRADSYFLGLLEAEGRRLRLELLYDEGTFYPPTYLDVESGLAGWVLSTRRPLLLRDVPRELPALGVRRRLVGKAKLNLSWMGVPLIAAGKVLGLVGVGSYRRNAFSTEDLRLLESVAQQVALALDNAYHHAEVEWQARHDSLTRVLNHGAFLQALEGALADYAARGNPVSLIMLDVDYFKTFNDRYGHLAGDLVLQQTVQTIRRHIKRRDLVGRWGGEEFAVALLRATGPQAWQVAQRIRRTLAELVIETPSGQRIPAPTVSQGIAVFPDEAVGVYSLVDLADQRLYEAKAHGRDQVVPATPDFWQTREAAEGTAQADASTSAQA